MERLISNVLRFGVILSAVLIMVGLVMMALSGTIPTHGTSAPLHLDGAGLSMLGQGLAELNGRAWVMLGLLCLVGTPVARVALSLVMYVRQHDMTYIAITSFVLAVLLLSLLVR